MSSRTAARIAVLMGGRSAEREVSLVSGRECAAALRQEGFEVVEIDAGPDLASALAAAKPDVAFNALHGRWGEDGCVQGMLEWLGIPYTHSGVLASALAMDKARAKQVFAAAGLPVARGMIACREHIRAAHPMEPPYVVKPNDEGSSVGVYIVPAAPTGRRRSPTTCPRRVLVEEYVAGRELTVAVIGDRALAVTDIIADGWYDYDAKYAPGGSRHVVPAEIPAEIAEACLDFALRAHRAIGCRGLSRSDFRWDEARGLGGLYLLEINTQPGMTPTSLAPGAGGACRHVLRRAGALAGGGRLVLPVRTAPRRDPAPSRLRYRLNRLWLRPGVPAAVNFGVPMLAGVLAAWTVMAQYDLSGQVTVLVGRAREAIVERPQFTITEIAVPDVRRIRRGDAGRCLRAAADLQPRTRRGPRCATGSRASTRYSGHGSGRSRAGCSRSAPSNGCRWWSGARPRWPTPGRTLDPTPPAAPSPSSSAPARLPRRPHRPRRLDGADGDHLDDLRHRAEGPRAVVGGRARAHGAAGHRRAVPGRRVRRSASRSPRTRRSPRRPSSSPTSSRPRGGRR